MVQLADMDLFVCRAGGKAFFRFPRKVELDKEKKKEKNYQSTSRAGAEWNANCCLQLPVAASQIIVVLRTRRRLLILFPRFLPSWWKWWKLDFQTNLSTPALRMKFPVLFHFKAKMGPCKKNLIDIITVCEIHLEGNTYLEQGFSGWSTFWNSSHLVLSKCFLKFSSCAPNPEVEMKWHQITWNFKISAVIQVFHLA